MAKTKTIQTESDRIENKYLKAVAGLCWVPQVLKSGLTMEIDGTHGVRLSGRCDAIFNAQEARTLKSVLDTFLAAWDIREADYEAMPNDLPDDE